MGTKLDSRSEPCQIGDQGERVMVPPGRRTRRSVGARAYVAQWWDG
jgi:hypothetical protein